MAVKLVLLLSLVSPRAALHASPRGLGRLPLLQARPLLRKTGAPVAVAPAASSFLLSKVVPTAGACMANLMFLSPLKAVLELRQTGVLGELNPVPWCAIVGNNMAWLGYSFAAKDPFVFAANLPGLLLGLFYVLSGTAYADAPTRATMEKLILSYAAVIGVTGFVAAWGLCGTAQAVFGICGNALLLLYYASPLSVIFKVLRTRSAASLYAPLSATNGFNGLLWTTYGFVIRDPYLLYPNAFGALVSGVQLVLIALFKGK